MYPRIIKIPKLNSCFLFGPRQTGKTSLLNREFTPDCTLGYNLLQVDEYLRLLARPTVLREEVESRAANFTHVLIDEIQRLPLLLDEVHFLMESKNPPCFILSGSSARKLKRLKANMLGGRAWTLRLHPLTYRELGEDFNLLRVLNLGALPKIWTTDDFTSQQMLRSYVETYIKEEIEAEALVRASGIFLRFLYQVGHESGNILNFSNLAREVGTSPKTVKEYFQILEDTLIGRYLLAYAKSRRGRLAAHPKFYLFDTGVQRALTKKLTVPIEPSTSEFGKAFEHFIINECFRLNDYLQKDYEFSFYRTEHGAEVDLIIETPTGKCIAIEIKASAHPVMANVRSGLMSFKTLRSDASLYCVCTAERRRVVEEIHFLPWREFLDEIF